MHFHCAKHHTTTNEEPCPKFEMEAGDASSALMAQSIPDDIRFAGWAVAVHNDYRLNGVAHTFWLFTKGDRNVKGEGLTDAKALNQIRAALGL